jgi:hypothetical protein
MAMHRWSFTGSTSSQKKQRNKGVLQQMSVLNIAAKETTGGLGMNEDYFLDLRTLPGTFRRVATPVVPREAFREKPTRRNLRGIDLGGAIR